MTLEHTWQAGSAIFVVTALFVLTTAIPQSTHTVNSSKKEEKVENTLARAVHHQLQDLPFYSVFDYLAFSIDGDKVTLTGQVQRPTLKSHAEAAVKSLEGVTHVVNNVAVIPASASDHELGRNIYRAIYENMILQKYAVEAVPSIHIIVQNGSVNLEGAIDSEADKTLAGNLAGKVPNVRGLRNNLVVHVRNSSAG